MPEETRDEKEFELTPPMTEQEINEFDKKRVELQAQGNLLMQEFLTMAQRVQGSPKFNGHAEFEEPAAEELKKQEEKLVASIQLDRKLEVRRLALISLSKSLSNALKILTPTDAVDFAQRAMDTNDELDLMWPETSCEALAKLQLSYPPVRRF